MHRISPFVVIYAILLLIIQYLYCMNLTEDELPTIVNSKRYNLAQIGFVRYKTYPCVPLLLKTLFTLTFWLTLRQTKYEDSVQSRFTIVDHGQREDTDKSRAMVKAVTFVKTVLLEIWIWVVVFTLFFFAMFGERMTVVRILHMALFLTFVITFQASFEVKLNIVHEMFQLGYSFISVTDFLENLEENDVHILDCCHWLFDVLSDYDLYISIQ